MPARRSRIHPKYKTKYRVSNWASYDSALVRRGDVTLWLAPEAITAWHPKPTGHHGAQRQFSDLAIETALTLRLVFNLPLRQAEGFLRSILRLMDLDLEAPDHTTLSRRGRFLRRGDPSFLHHRSAFLRPFGRVAEERLSQPLSHHS